MVCFLFSVTVLAEYCVIVYFCNRQSKHASLAHAVPTAVSSEAWAKLRDWASVAGRGWLLLLGSVAHASLKTAVHRILLQLQADIHNRMVVLTLITLRL